MDTAQTDREVGLAQLLGNDLRGSVGVQKAVAQNLAHRLVGPPVVGFGTGFVRLERGQAAGLVIVQELVITLATQAIFFGGHGDVIPQTLAFDEHEEPAGQRIGGSHGQGAGRADHLLRFGIELQQGIMHELTVAAAAQYV